MKKYLHILFLFTIIFGVSLVLASLSIQGSSKKFAHTKNNIIPIETPSPVPLSLSGGIVPHHIVAEKIIDDFFLEIGKAGPKRIILLSPDHWSRGKYYLNTADTLEKSKIPIDLEFIQNIQKLLPEDSFGLDASLIAREHGITALLPYIHTYAPNASLVPVAIHQLANKKILGEFISAVSQVASGDTLVVSSVDFSHYLSTTGAQFHDARSKSVIEQFDFDSVPTLELDSWQSIYGALLFAKNSQAEKIKKIGSADSAQMQNSGAYADEVTSYYSVIFEKGERMKAINQTTLLAFGDVMLGRNVENTIKKHGDDHTFKNIRQLLRGNDLVLANLEGPFQKNHIQTPSGSTRFSFNPSYAKILFKNNFSALSLANNHTLDYGEKAYFETRDILGKLHIETFGNPGNLPERYVLEKTIRGKKFIFIGLNSVLAPIDEKTALELIQKKSDKNSITIVSIHWGDEYVPQSNSWQKKFAKKMIDAGAGLVLGHHPHVVQEIEKYKNRLIFYSLGNFIFDQYFSKETQEGLGVGIIFSEKENLYSLFPFTIAFSQPELMKSEERKKFLSGLAEKSPDELQNEIKSGTIKLNQ